MISSSKTGNYDRSVQPVLHIKASKEGDQYECNPLKWAGMVSQTLFQSDTSIFMISLWRVFAGSRGLDRFFPFLYYIFLKKATVFDVLKRYSLIKWTMALQTRVTKGVSSQMKDSFTNMWNKGKKRRKFHPELKCLKCISMTGSQRLANSLMQAIRLSLSICLCRKRQTMDKWSSHSASRPGWIQWSCTNKNYILLVLSQKTSSNVSHHIFVLRSFCRPRSEPAKGGGRWLKIRNLWHLLIAHFYLTLVALIICEGTFLVFALLLSSHTSSGSCGTVRDQTTVTSGCCSVDVREPLAALATYGGPLKRHVFFKSCLPGIQAVEQMAV